MDSTSGSSRQYQAIISAVLEEIDRYKQELPCLFRRIHRSDFDELFIIDTGAKPRTKFFFSLSVEPELSQHFTRKNDSHSFPRANASDNGQK